MMKGTKPLRSPSVKVMWVKGIIQARPAMYTDARETRAVGAIVMMRRSAPRSAASPAIAATRKYPRM